MLTPHYMLITTSRTFVYADALAYLGGPPFSNRLSMCYPLFKAVGLKFHLPFDFFFFFFFTAPVPTYFFSEILLGPELVPHSLVRLYSLMLSPAGLIEDASVLMELELSQKL